MNILKKFNNATSCITDNLAWIALGVLALIVFFQVLNREIFQLAITWTEELARFLFVWITLIGAAVCSRSKSHIRVDMIFQLWPSRLTAVLGLIGDVITLFYFGLLTYCSYIWSSSFFGVLSQTMRIPIVAVYLVIPVCAFCMFFLELERMLHNCNLFQKTYITHEMEREHSILEKTQEKPPAEDGETENDNQGGE